MKNVMTANDNLNKMYQFLDRHGLPKFTQEEIQFEQDFIYKRNCINIYKPSKIQSTRQNKFTGEFYQTVKGGITSILQSLSQKTEVEEITRNLFCEVSIPNIKIRQRSHRKTTDQYHS